MRNGCFGISTRWQGAREGWPPDTVSGVAVSLQTVFAAIAAGVYSLFGPSVGSLLTLSLTDATRRSQRNATAVFGGPIAGVVDLGRLNGQREIGERLPAGRGAFHEILNFL